MGIQEAVGSCLSNYVGFDGRAERPEFWWWVLFVVAIWTIQWSVCGAVLGVDSGAGAVAGGLFLLFTLLPGCAVGVRRLHDLDRPGWWMLFWLLPVIGWAFLLYMLAQPGTPGPNRHGNGKPVMSLV